MLMRHHRSHTYIIYVQDAAIAIAVIVDWCFCFDFFSKNTELKILCINHIKPFSGCPITRLESTIWFSTHNLSQKEIDKHTRSFESYIWPSALQALMNKEQKKKTYSMHIAWVIIFSCPEIASVIVLLWLRPWLRSETSTAWLLRAMFNFMYMK